MWEIEKRIWLKSRKKNSGFGALYYMWDITRDWKNIRKYIKITVTVITGIYESNQRKSCCDAVFQKFLDQTKQTVFCYEI
jgi:hypothetical protein